jgi:hypothetical protein
VRLIIYVIWKGWIMESSHGAGRPHAQDDPEDKLRRDVSSTTEEARRQAAGVAKSIAERKSKRARVRSAGLRVL